MVYLIDNPPRIRQYRSPRRERPSGVCLVHTAESFPDETDPDTGAENVARFIRERTNYGSYHDLCDSDSIVNLVDYGDEAFHDATGSNPHSYGVSAATQAHKWRELGEDWVDATVRNMARASARYARWIKTEYGVVIPAKRVSRAESEARKPGFISHAERDPQRRTDPGRTFPWGQFLNDYAAEMEDDMAFTLNEMAERMAAVLRQHDGNPIGEHNGRELSRDEATLRAAEWSGGTNNRVRYGVLPALGELLGRPVGDVDEQALAQALAQLLPQVDTASILAAIQQLPSAVRAELKAAL